MTITTYYPNDVARLAALGPRLQDFEAWFAALEAEHEQLGFPYGNGSLAETTGLGGWIEFYNEGTSPKDSLDEDLCDNYA